MLTLEENELLTHTGPGTPMEELMWPPQHDQPIPACAKYLRPASRAVTDRWDCRPDRERDIPLPGSQVSSEPRWPLPVPYKPA